MCGVCEHEPMNEGPELSIEDWKGVLRSGAKLGVSIVSLSGGEPLLRGDVFEFIRYTRELGMALHMCSNGVLLNRENVLRLRDSGVNTVSISLESSVPEIHETLRGKGTFEPAVESIRLLRELAPDVHIGINYLITTVNYKNMAAMIPFAESLGVHQIKFAPIHTNLLHKRKRLESYRDLIFTEEALEDLDREVQELMKATARSRIQTTSTVFLSGITQLYSKPRTFRCLAGYAACAVTPSGIVVPCCDMEGTISVRDKPLDVIWRSEEFKPFREQVHHCNSSCWDTTNAELSLRLRPASLIGDLVETWRDIGFYLGDEER